MFPPPFRQCGYPTAEQRLSWIAWQCACINVLYSLVEKLITKIFVIYGQYTLLS